MIFHDVSRQTNQIQRAAALSLSLGCLSLGFLGCAPSEPASEAEGSTGSEAVAELPTVVATSSVVCNLAEQIAQDTVTLTCLLEPGQDPHTYEPTPSDRKAIDDADLILGDGYNFSPDIDELLEATQNPAPQVAVLEEAVPDPLMGAAHSHDHGEDHSHEGEEAAAHDHEHADEAHADDAHTDDAHADEHDHEGEESAARAPDPHIWHDAEHGIAMVSVIQANLEAIAPDQTDLYAQNAAAIIEQLQTIDTWIQDQVATVPEGDRILVTTHDAFRYYANAYKFTVGGALSGLSTEEEISAGQLAELVDQVKATGVPAIFAETTTNPKSIETVAQNAGVEVAPQALFVEGPGGPGSVAETYQEMLVVNTCTLVEGIGGTCAIDEAPI